LKGGGAKSIAAIVLGRQRPSPWTSSKGDCPVAEQFIGAAIQPVAGTIDAVRMDVGAPGLPRQFRWKARTIQIARVLRTWRETGPCRHGSGEAYVRKHWFEVLTDSGELMKIYFERQRRSRKNIARWWLFSVVEGADSRSG
jgi:hypothetical protein